MTNRIKIFTVEITHPDTWYSKRIGEKFEARLQVKENGVIAFKINQSPFFFINQLHCKVLDEKIIETNY